jgi:hypothetical protein
MSSVKKVRKLDNPPEILYESPSYPGEKVSPIPYVIIPKDKDMPVGLFIMRYSQTGEFEVGDSGKPEEIMDGPHPHMFIDFKHLEEVLHETFPSLHMGDAIDKIRVGLGMKPLDKARKDGNDLIDRVVAKANDIAATAFEKQQERKAEYESKLKSDMKEDQSQ